MPGVWVVWVLRGVGGGLLELSIEEESRERMPNLQAGIQFLLERCILIVSLILDIKYRVSDDWVHGYVPSLLILAILREG